MVATVAFGMGVHKPDIRYIVHLDMPRTIEQYYQEIGRAGRDGLPAECLLLYGIQDLVIYKKFLEQLADPFIRKEMKAKTDRMYRLCTSVNCRRRELLRYFGEEFQPKSCGACDNCVVDAEQIEGTVTAQKILSCVFRLKQNVGIRMVVDVLRGSKNQNLLQRRYHELSTYSLLAELPEEEVRYYIESLLHLGLLDLTEGDYPVLKWTEQSRGVVEGSQPVYFKKRKFKSAKEEGERFRKPENLCLHYDEQLFEALRQLRLAIAREEQVPPYVVFSDRSLQEMALHFPQTQQEFSRINGVGPIKWFKYGEKFSEVIRGHQGAKPTFEREQVTAPLQRQHSREETLRLYQQGKSIEQIMQERQLARSTIITHLVEAIQEGNDLNLAPLLSEAKQATIKLLLNELGAERLAPIKERLPEDFTYDEIRLVAAGYRQCISYKKGA